MSRSPTRAAWARQVVFDDIFECPASGGHPELVASESAQMRSRSPLVVALVVEKHREGHSAADRLRETDGVGHDARVFERVHRPRSADACLDLVNDEGDVVFPSDPAHLSEPLVGRGDRPALALYRFDDHRPRVFDT